MPKFALVALFAVSAVAQQEIWVEPLNGNNGNPGSFNQPLQTLTAAVALAGPSDRIHLRSGTYGPNFNGEVLPIQIGQTPQTGLVIRGIGDVTFDLAGSNLTLFQLLNGADGARITNLTIRNTDQTGWWTRAINSGSGVNSGMAADNVEIDRCRFIDINRGFVLWTADAVTGWRIHDNLFVNCSNDAILEYTGTNEISHNTFHTGAFKAYISDSSTSLCYNNLIASYAIAFENNNATAPLARYQGNWLYQCAINQQGVGMAGALPTSNRIGIDPQFVSPSTGNYHVQTTSPTIDAGTLPPLPGADLDADSRLVDGDGDGLLEADVGCYETTPLALTVTWDPATALMWFNGSTTLAGTYGFVIFSFDDGVASFPGQGPILVDLATVVPFTLQGALPQQWVLSFTNYVAPPGQRLVVQILGVGPNHVGSAVFGGNQVWVQF